MSDKVRTGGLMRCCLESLDKSYEDDPERRAQEGDRLPCQWCSSGMAFRDGAWEWDHPWKEGEERR